MFGERETHDWQQINFRTVKTVLGMEFLHELYNRYHPEINCLRFRNTVLVTDGNQVTSYAPQHEWDFMGRWFSRRFLHGDEEVQQSLEQYLTRDKDRLHTFLEEMQDLDIAGLDDTELGMYLIDTQYIPLTELYTVNHVQIEHALDIAIDEGLREQFPDEEEFNRARAAVIYADRTTVGVEEKERFYAIVRDGLEEGIEDIREHPESEVAERLHEHFEEYRYIHSAYGAEPYQEEYYLDRYAKVAGKGRDHVEDQLRQIEEGDTASAERRQEYLDQIDDPTLERNIELMAKVGTLRDRNKALLGRTTRWREALLDEISDRTDVPRDELNWYFLEEICALLEDGTAIDAETIADRQDGMVLRRGEHAAHDIDIDIDEEHEAVLEGECASPGQYEGTARVVRDSSDAAKMSLGDIMVAPGTDFDLINAMQRSGAIITEEGGILSHASVISRELDIPCVIGVPGATEQLTDGTRIRIDADAGTVEIIGEQ